MPNIQFAAPPKLAAAPPVAGAGGEAMSIEELKRMAEAKKAELASGPKLEDIVSKADPSGRYSDFTQIGEGVSGLVYKGLLLSDQSA